MTLNYKEYTITAWPILRHLNILEYWHIVIELTWLSSHKNLKIQTVEKGD